MSRSQRSALLGVLPVTLIHSQLGATALLRGVATVFAIGERVHSVVHGPVIVDLAPPHLFGRHISALALTVTGGFAIGPDIGGAVFAYSPDAVWWGGALVIDVGFLLVGDRIPDKPMAATEPTATPGHAVREPA